MYRGSVQDVHSLPDAPDAAQRGGAVHGDLVLPSPHHVVGPGHVLLPLRPPAVPGRRDPPDRARPAVGAEGGALQEVLLLLLAVGDAADGAVGGASVGVLVGQLLLHPHGPPSVLGQSPRQAAPQGAGGRRRGEGVGVFLLLGQSRNRKRLLVGLTQRPGPPAAALGLGALVAALLHHADPFATAPGRGLHRRAGGEAGGGEGACGHLGVREGGR